MTKISVITVNFNNAEGLQRTLQSIFSQNIAIESIVIDGGSTDRSIEVIRSFEDEITYWCSEPDKGIYDAMNKGILKATGLYINFMNSGDVFTKDSLAKVTKAIEFDQFSIDLYFGDIIQESIARKSSEYYSQPDRIDFPHLLLKTINHQSIFLKTTYLKTRNFDTRFSIIADWIHLFETFRHHNISYSKLIFPICIYDIDGLSAINDQQRLQQRSTYLKEVYQEWELDDLLTFARIRSKSYYHNLIVSLDSPRRTSFLTTVLRFLYGQFSSKERRTR